MKKSWRKELNVKKPVTEDRTFCDYCEAPGYTQCLVCGKDLCPEHRLELVVYLDRQDWAFRASLCREDALALAPVLKNLAGKSIGKERVGQNPEFNEARLADILAFLRTGAGAESGAAKV